MTRRRTSLFGSILLAAIAAAALSGCIPLQRPNPHFFVGGKWEKVESPYALTSLLICEYGAAGNEKVNLTIEEYVAPALWRAYRQEPTQAKVKVLAGGSPWCDELPKIYRDNFIVPPHLQKQLAQYVKESGAKGVIIPMAVLYRSQMTRDIRGSDGTTIASMNIDQFYADGTAYFQVHYVNESGELIHTGRSESLGHGGTNIFDENLKDMRNDAPRIAEELLREAPPVTLQ